MNISPSASEIYDNLVNGSLVELTSISLSHPLAQISLPVPETHNKSSVPSFSSPRDTYQTHHSFPLPFSKTQILYTPSSTSLSPPLLYKHPLHPLPIRPHPIPTTKGVHLTHLTHQLTKPTDPLPHPPPQRLLPRPTRPQNLNHEIPNPPLRTRLPTPPKQQHRGVVSEIRYQYVTLPSPAETPPLSTPRTL